NRAQGLLDEGRVCQAFGDATGALTLFEEALDAMAADALNRPQVGETVRRRSLMLATTVYQLALQGMDPDGMERCARRIGALVDALPISVRGDRGLEGALRELLARAATAGSDPSEIPAGVETISMENMGRDTVEQAQVLVPLYRATYARDAGDDER